LGVVVLAVHAAVGAVAEAGETPPNGTPLILRVGYSEGLFVGNLARGASANDVRATTQAWVQMVIEHNTGRPARAETRIYAGPSSIEQDLRAGAVDLLILLPQDYLDIRNTAPVVPALSPTYGAGDFSTHLLLVRRDSGVKDLAGLRGKHLILDAAKRGSVPQWWLDSALRRARLPEATAFFSNVKEASRSSQGILSVFFRNADACVTARNTLSVVAEMNPQVGKELVPLETSPEFIGGVIAYHEAIGPLFNEVLDAGLKSLHTHPTGRQLLTFFGVRQLIPFEAQHLKSVEHLVREARARNWHATP
jgi:ABC-type phosphate/phosphonate transport system substrate-binding protein